MSFESIDDDEIPEYVRETPPPWRNPFRRRWGLVTIWPNGDRTPIGERFWFRSGAVLRQSVLARADMIIEVVDLG